MHSKKTNKTLKFILIPVVLVLLFAGTFFLLHNKPGNTEETGSPSSAASGGVSGIAEDFCPAVSIYDPDILELLQDETLGDEEKELLNAPMDYEPLEDTTYTKLHKAFEAGEITGEEYSKLLILQQYQPEAIPQKFTGAKGFESINHAYQYIADNWDNLSEETRELVGPYVLPISDPGSYYFRENLEQEKIVSRPDSKKAFSLICTASAADMTKQLVRHEFTVDGQKITIEYYEYNSWSDNKKLEYNMCVRDVEEAITHSYGEFEALLTASLSKPVKIEIVPLDEGTNGEAWYESDCYRIRLATANYENYVKTKAVAAHELFHNFQFEIGLKIKGIDRLWLMEATAKWAEHYAFEEYNTEHGYLNYFFRTLDRDRIHFGKNYEYSGYMLFYYFSDYGQYDIVPEILHGTVRNGEDYIRKFLSDHVAGMRNQYADYAYKNLNMVIAKQYYDYGDLPGRPTGKSYRSLWMMAEEEDTREVSLNPGALQYHYYIFDRDEEIQHVKFKFDKTFDEDKYIKRQAVVKINGKWQLEDWSGVDEVIYHKCSDLTDEKIQGVVLIYSNSNFFKDGTENPVDVFKVTTEKCPQEMDIKIEAEYEYINGDFIWTANATLKDTVKIVDHTFFLSKNCRYTMQGTGIMEGETVIGSTGSFSGSVDEPNLENSMVRLILPIDSELEEMGTELEKFGINENTPRGGIFITLPSIEEGEDLQGSTTLYMPEPVGEIVMDDPLPFDGLTQAIAVEIGKDDWNPKGFSTEMVIDYFTHKPPILDWFKVDFSQLQNMLSSMETMNGTEMPDFNGIPDISGQLEGSGISMEGLGSFGGVQDLFPKNSIGEGDTITKTINALKNLTMPQSAGTSDMSATIKLKISGEYVKYN